VTTVQELKPGDVFEMGGETATLLVTHNHPVYRHAGMALVVWWLHKEQRYSFDALLWIQELPGKVVNGPLGYVSQDQLDRAWLEGAKGANL
jgi:hypothetical protein